MQGEKRPILRHAAGQATLEYILLLSVLVGVSIAIPRAILKSLDTGILTLGGELEKNLKTGRVPLSVWQN